MSDAINLMDVAEARLSPGMGMAPPGASFGPGGTLMVDGASYGPSQWIPSSGDLAGSPIVPSLANASGAPNWAFIQQQNSILAQALSATGPNATSRSLARSAPTAAELDKLRETNPVAWDRIQDLTPAEMSGLIIEQSGKDAIIYIPGEGWTTSVNDREGFIDIGIFKEIFISKGGTDNLANFLGITQVPQKAGNWYAFGGLIDFGAPGVPGAGNGTIWFVPNRVLGADMTAFFDYHDRNYYHKNDGGKPTTLADIGKILDVEWGSFMAGISAEGAGPLTLALQMVYSTATTAIGVGTAAWNSVKGLLGPLANLPSGLSLSTLGPLLNAADNPVGAAMALLSPTGALSSALGNPAGLTCHRMPPPPPPSGGGEDGILVSMGISDSEAAAAAAQYEIGAESTDCGSSSGEASSSSSDGGAPASESSDVGADTSSDSEATDAKAEESAEPEEEQPVESPNESSQDPGAANPEEDREAETAGDETAATPSDEERTKQLLEETLKKHNGDTLKAHNEIQAKRRSSQENSDDKALVYAHYWLKGRGLGQISPSLARILGKGYLLGKRVGLDHIYQLGNSDLKNQPSPYDPKTEEWFESGVQSSLPPDGN